MKAAELRECRERLGLSQEDLAQELGVTQGAVSRWESEDERKNRPIPEWVPKLIRFIEASRG